MPATMIEAAAKRAIETSDTGLVEQILCFDLSNGELADFEPRLRRENGWSASFARRAIEEYKKFLVLAAIARHAVSPSDVVDQVWHLHLLYTRSYWNDLCANVLPEPLHHAPSTGAAGEGAKFEDWYVNTLASYRRVFGEEPPSDIWPPPWNKTAPRHRYVDLERCHVIPRIGGLARVGIVMLIIALLMLLGGCSANSGVHASDLARGPYNPLNLRGPQFLVLYQVAFAIACTIAYQVRARARATTNDDVDDVRRFRIDLDPYEIAYLNGGPVLAANAAIARLVDRGEIDANADGTLRRYSADPHASIDAHPLERAVFAAVGARRTPIKDIRPRLESSLASIRRGLDDSGYLLDRDRALAARWTASLVALSVPAVGVIKLLIGLERHRPVQYLVLLTVGFVAISLAAFARGLHRSRRGDRVLEHLKTRHARVRTHPVAGGIGQDAMLALGVGLFGLRWLSGSEHADLRRALTPKSSSGDGWDFNPSCGGGGSCGGSGCGGGGCGGGGCGGGGCGGCGGG